MSTCASATAAAAIEPKGSGGADDANVTGRGAAVDGSVPVEKSMRSPEPLRGSSIRDSFISIVCLRADE